MCEEREKTTGMARHITSYAWTLLHLLHEPRQPDHTVPIRREKEIIRTVQFSPKFNQQPVEDHMETKINKQSLENLNAIKKKKTPTA